MSTVIAQDRRAKILADWQEAIEDKQALLKAPEAYTQQLIEQAAEAFTAGIINWEDLRELKEWADGAYSWTVEEEVAARHSQAEVARCITQAMDEGSFFRSSR